MDSFKQFQLNERFVNLLPHHEDEKHKHSKEVFDMVHKAYSKMGGIHGSGFKDHHDMVKNIHMWKLHKKDGKVRSVALYKNGPSGRKRVAVATDGTPEGKHGLGRMMHDDVKRHRSFNELSGASLGFLKKNVGDVKPHALPHHEVKKHLKGDEIRPAPHDDEEVKRHPELKDHFYQRKIGDHWHTKVMVGTPGKHIK